MGGNNLVTVQYVSDIWWLSIDTPLRLSHNPLRYSYTTGARMLERQADSREDSRESVARAMDRHAAPHFLANVQGASRTLVRFAWAA